MALRFRTEQEVANFFQCYMARDSNGRWHGFNKPPRKHEQWVKDDNGEDIKVGYWDCPDEGGQTCFTFYAGIQSEKTWDESFTKAEKNNGKKPQGNSNKGGNNKNFKKGGGNNNKKFNNNNKKNFNNNNHQNNNNQASSN